VKRSNVPVTSSQNKANDLPVLLFTSQHEGEAWLHEHHTASRGVWLRHAKKASGLQSVSYAEALGVALCYGWIDGQKKSYDESSWLQKWTPRAAKSIWSNVNREKIGQLIENERMQPAGIAAVEAAKRDGRWDAAYDSLSQATVPDDFQAALDTNPQANAFFATLNKQNRYAILWRIQTAKKAETRAKRIQQFIEMLERHEKLHP
jgi:uncharacterized protein YdeI (YjbR/CyaY-like superfamily)